MTDEHRETYTASPCPCGHRLCGNWHVSPVAAVQGVGFTEKQARIVASVLIAVENGWDWQYTVYPGSKYGRCNTDKPAAVEPIPMLLHCPMCSERHIDEGEFATKVHHTHACQTCGHVWRPAVVPTVGVRFLPGFKND